jgi:hypothetical protein
MFNLTRVSAEKYAIRAFLATAALCAAMSGFAQTSPKQVSVPPPPMGWSSWNSFSNTVNSEIVMSQAKAMVSSGMAKAGYQYINIDEGWWLGERDAEGNILVDHAAWPAIEDKEDSGDMRNIVRFIHSQGLKAGIYTDAGMDGCSTVGPDLGPSYPHTGSEGHYEQDFLQFAKWGFDYVKVDWCGGDKENLDPAVQYAEIAQAIARAEAITGHTLYFSICNWGKNSPWTWAPNIGGVKAAIWRTGGDIVAPIVAGTKNADRKAELKEVLREFDQAQHPDAQHTGFYNDPDMMVVGMPGLTELQNRVHMSLWAISGGPLLAGADLSKLTPADLATLTNPEVLAIDQDPLGLQSYKVASPAKGLEVWSKPLTTPGERAVLLLNRTGAAEEIGFHWNDLGLRSDGEATVRDPWERKDIGQFVGNYSAPVPAEDAVLLIVLGKEGATTLAFPDEMKGSASFALSVPLGPRQQATFSKIGSRLPVARARITYSNPGKVDRVAELRVNDRAATRIIFPPTGAEGSFAFVSIECTLDIAGRKNVLSFSSPLDAGPAIQSISIE